MVKTKQTTGVALIFFLIVMMGSLQQIMARPKAAAPLNSLDKLTGCQIDRKLQETCQRCAKATKSNIVYPMCCSNEDEAYIWCQRYMEYGIH